MYTVSQKHTKIIYIEIAKSEIQITTIFASRQSHTFKKVT